MEKYAVIKIKDKQFFVKEGTTVKAHPVLETSQITVLAAGFEDGTVYGLPVLENVSLKIQDLGLKRIKTETRRYKSKSRYRKNKSHTDTYSYLKVLEISPTGGSINLVKENKVSSDPASLKKPKVKKTTIKNKSNVKSIEDLGISENIISILKDNNINTVSQVEKMTKEDLIALKGLGKKKADEIISKLGKIK